MAPSSHIIPTDTDELTAINQYMVHSEMCDNWGYDKLHEAIEKLAKDEMHHADLVASYVGKVERIY